MEKFLFTAENLEKAKEHLAKYPADHQQSALLPLLTLAQQQCKGWLPIQAIEFIANFLQIPAIKVYEVASFYSLFYLKPVGKYHVQICGTTPCMLRGCETVKNACEEHLGIKCGEVTSDQQFSLQEVECLGVCVDAPIIRINEQVYEKVSSQEIVGILEELADQ